jgi:hypothetical protein
VLASSGLEKVGIASAAAAMMAFVELRIGDCPLSFRMRFYLLLTMQSTGGN